MQNAVLMKMRDSQNNLFGTLLSKFHVDFSPFQSEQLMEGILNGFGYYPVDGRRDSSYKCKDEGMTIFIKHVYLVSELGRDMLVFVEFFNRNLQAAVGSKGE